MIRAHYKVLQDFLNMLLMGVVTGVVFSLALTGAVFLVSGSARAAEEPHVLGSPSEAGQGSLLFKSEQGYVTAPTLKTGVSMRVTGLLARVKVSQRFQNPSQTSPANASRWLPAARRRAGTSSWSGRPTPAARRARHCSPRSARARATRC